MKKLVFLTALLAFLLMGFASCSDSEDGESGPVIEWVDLFSIAGRLTYDSDSTGYLLELSEESDKLVNDTLIPRLGEKPTKRVKVIKVKADYSETSDGTKISSMVGSYVSISFIHLGFKKEAGSDCFIVEFSHMISVIKNKHKITTPEGRELTGRTLNIPQRAMTVSTAGLAKGQYQIEITDAEGEVHRGRFGI